MSDSCPKVTVLIPHYNMSEFLQEAVQSVADQDYKNIELVVIDDGSDRKIDGDLLSDFTFEAKLVEIDHSGKPKAVNKGLEVSSGDYFTILDADDRLPPKSISHRITALENHEADLCIGSFEVLYDCKRQSVRPISNAVPKTKQEIIRDFLVSVISPFHQNAMLFSKSLLQRVGRMDPEMIRGQDKDFAVRLIKKSRQIAYLEKPVYIYHRYDRPFGGRIYNRITGTKYKLIVIHRYTKGVRKFGYLVWEIFIGTAKLIHDIFGIYKK